MRQSFSRGLWIAPVIFICGCGWLPWPNLYNPGPAHYQLRRALQHDPYPEDETGPPVEGGRPQGFEKGLPEPARVQQRLW